MSTNFAELNYRVALELEMLLEFLQLDQIHNAVVQKHNVRVAQSRNSTTNVLLGVSGTFTPAATVVDITSYIGFGTPAFLETQDDQGKWQPIRIVPLSQLHDYMQLNILAACFYGEESSDTTIDPVQYVAFSFIPQTLCRIRFDRDSVRSGLAENVLLPDHVAELIVKEAQNTLIPRLKAAIVHRCRSDKELKEISKDWMVVLSEISLQNDLDKQDLKALWMEWAYKDRSSDSGVFTKPTPSSRAAYGGRG